MLSAPESNGESLLAVVLLHLGKVGLECLCKLMDSTLLDCIWNLLQPLLTVEQSIPELSKGRFVSLVDSC